MTELTWEKCYDSSWKGLIVDAAFAHPAKMSRGLLVRIFDHLFERGYVTSGSTIVDPFGGIGTTGIEGASRGCRVVCVELEEKFVKLAQQNFALHRRTWEQMGDPLPVILQGDSRRLCAILSEGGALVSSPPYAESIRTGHKDGIDWDKATNGRGDTVSGRSLGRGAIADDSPGQLGSMPEGAAIVSSPPYADQITGANAERETADESRAKRKTPGGSTGASIRHGGYGQSPGNLSALVSSPPYEGSIDCSPNENTKLADEKKQSVRYSSNGTDNMGNSSGETFWSAAAQLVQQCYLILPPGGIAVWVVKRYVCNKQIVDFSDQWRQMCEACGFETVEWIRAMLTKEWTENSLFEGPRVRRKERKSFFRRLAEKKGSPRIDHEDVLVMRRS